uniref:Aminotransferase class I/classII large domain-containing protein n=1 Tax=Physcomitrium patens TaxID=3218 RepID=A0A7I3ZZV1_PHYPA
MVTAMASSAASAALVIGQEVIRGNAAQKFSGLRIAAFPQKNGNITLCSQGKSRAVMSVATDVSRFESVSMAPADPILGVSEAFKKDNSDKKLNLGVGAYRTEELQPYVLEVVKKAEKKMLEGGDNKEYLPIEGLAAFNKVTAELLLGADNAAIKENRVATVQGLSGTGSLRLGAAFLQRYFPGTTVYISSPTWGNHKNIFNDAGVPWKEYRYFDPKTVGLDFEGMIEDIQNAPEGSIILLHGCAHNPTGIDPTPEQWEKIADLIQSKNHMAFFDVAYQQESWSLCGARRSHQRDCVIFRCCCQG